MTEFYLNGIDVMPYVLDIVELPSQHGKRINIVLNSLKSRPLWILANEFRFGTFPIFMTDYGYFEFRTMFFSLFGNTWTLSNHYYAKLVEINIFTKKEL